MTTLHEGDTGAPSWHSSQDFGLDLVASAAMRPNPPRTRPWSCVCVHILMQNASVNEFRSFHMLGTEKCSQKRQIFCRRAQYRVLHHRLRARNHGLWRHGDNYGFPVSRLVLNIVSLFILLMCVCKQNWGYRWNQQNFLYLLVYLAHNVQVVHSGQKT